MMSFGRFAGEEAVFCCSSSSDWTSCRPRSSSAASTRRPLRGPVAHHAGVGAQERRRPRHAAAVDDGEVQREVVPLDPPAPGLLRPRLAEDREEVQLRVAAGPAALLDLLQDLLEADDGDGLDVAALPQAAAEQRMGERAAARGPCPSGAVPCARAGRSAS